MKLDRLQRYTAYCILLWEFENNSFPGQGFCWAIGQIFMDNQSQETSDWLGSIRYFPEIKQKKPAGVGRGLLASWFGVGCDVEFGRQERIKILKQCIAETSPH